MSVINTLESGSHDDELRQVELTLQHPDCWTLEATAEYPDTHIVERSLYPAENVIKGDFVLVSKSDVSVVEFAAAIDEFDVVESVTVLNQSHNRARAVVVYERHSSIVPEMVNSECMPIAPVHITAGREHWTVLVRASALSDVVESMEYDVELDVVQAVDLSEDVPVVDIVDRVYSDLSVCQRQSLRAARDRNYYTWPRGSSASEIADVHGVSEPTFLEHLRRGEQKILHAVIDEMEHRHEEFSCP